MAGMRKAVDLVGKAMRETGHAMDRLTLTVAENEIFRDTFARHRQKMPLKDKAPVVHKNAFVAPNASVIGSVHLMDGSSVSFCLISFLFSGIIWWQGFSPLTVFVCGSMCHYYFCHSNSFIYIQVWYRTVMRADKHAIKVGKHSNIQDQAMIQCTVDNESAFPPNTVIGNYVTVGHGARLTSCLVADQCLIGQGSVVSEGCVVNTGAIIAAGAVLPPNTHVPAMQLWAGNPAKFVRAVTDSELAASITGATEYCKLAKEASAGFDAFDKKYNHQ